MPDYIFKGSLAENPLPEVLQKINYYKVPGVLTSEDSQGKKQIFIVGGEIIFASSSFPQDRLGEFLLEQERITSAQYETSVRDMRSTNKRQGTVLVEAGVLTPQELFESVKQQVMAIVWSLFNWTDGEVTFKVGKYKDDEIIKLNLDTRFAILEGIKRMKDPKRLVKRLGRREDVFEPTDHALTLLPSLPLSTEDKGVFRLVDGERTFLQVIQTSSLDSGKTAKVLYALFVLGLIRKKNDSISIVIPGAGATGEK
jgi:hypothetical protein